MNILVTGATGFIASEIVKQLLEHGHNVTCFVRDVVYARHLFPTAKLTRGDFLKADDEHFWLPHLENIDIVINAVGIMHHPNQKIIKTIHYETPKALFNACVRASIKKIIQISALGIDQNNTIYATTKAAADQYLLDLPISSIIVRPSLVYGIGSYGGMSLFRGLSGLPYFLPVPGRGEQRLQPIHVEDFAKAVVHWLTLQEEKIILAAVGPKQESLADILKTLRLWLGFGKAAVLQVPLFCIHILAYLGTLIAYSVLNLNSYKMLLQNNIATPQQLKLFESHLNFKPRDFSAGLFSHPSTVQDRWHARLYFLKPILRLALAFMWLMSAISSAFLYPRELSYQQLAQIGISVNWQPWFLWGACALNFLIGLGLLFNIAKRPLGILQLIVILIYTSIITWYLPGLWIEPFGPVVKNIPILVAVLISMAWENER